MYYLNQHGDWDIPLKYFAFSRSFLNPRGTYRETDAEHLPELFFKECILVQELN